MEIAQVLKRQKVKKTVRNDLIPRGCPSLVKGGGFRSRWRRPAWVQIPPPAPKPPHNNGSHIMVGLYVGLYFAVAVVNCWLYNLARIGNDYCLNVGMPLNRHAHQAVA